MFDINKICDLQQQMFLDIPATKGVDRALLQNIIDDCQSLHWIAYSAKIAMLIITKKPFNSLNKRVALALITTALERNNFEFIANSTQSLQFTNEIENGLSLDKIEAFIIENSKPL